MKRIFDIVTSLTLIIILSPFLIMISLMVIIFNGLPVFFLQERPGLNEVPFKMIKFRTMTDKRDSKGKLLPDEQRLNKLGLILRSASLDELPEFFNVLKGDMSIVGPRPLLMHYLNLYTLFQKRRHEVKPGITGWAQINGRNALNWEDRFKMDVWYVDNYNFFLDIKIIFITFVKILKREGINAENTTTMKPFTGSNK